MLANYTEHFYVLAQKLAYLSYLQKQHNMVIISIIITTIIICSHNGTHYGPASLLNDHTLRAGRVDNGGAMLALPNILPVPVRLQWNHHSHCHSS